MSESEDRELRTWAIEQVFEAYPTSIDDVGKVVEAARKLETYVMEG